MSRPSCGKYVALSPEQLEGFRIVTALSLAAQAKRRHARELAGIWFRAFLIVTITAINVTQISAGHYGAAFVTGGALSFVWWVNARTAARSEVAGAQGVYAFGAACGTVTGMFLGRLIG